MQELRTLDPLSRCVKLQHLTTSLSRVADLGPLADLTQLTHLDLHFCTCIYDISPLAGLINLTDVNLSW